MAKLELLSRTQYDANGVQTVWDFNFAGGYILPEHVKAYYEIGSVRTPVTVNLIGANQAYIVPAVPAGAVLTIYRETPKNAPLVDFVDRGTVSEVALDTVAKQAVFAAAESSDSATTGSVDVAVAAATAAQASALAAAGSASAADASKEAAEGYLASIVSIVSSAVASVYSTLAGWGGAALIGFKQLLPGSVSRTVGDKLAEQLSVKDFGAVGDGVADDAGAIQAAMTAALASGKKLFVPAGTYLLGSPLSININNDPYTRGFLMEGEGENSKFVIDHGGTGVRLVCSPSFMQFKALIRGIYFTGSGASLTRFIHNDGACNTVISDCFFFDATVTTGCVVNDNAYGLSLNGCVFSGIVGVGALYAGIASMTTYSYVNSITDCDFSTLSQGIVIQGVNALHVSSTVFQECNTAVYADPVPNTVQAFNMTFDTCWFERNTSTDLYLNSTASNWCEATIRNCQFSGFDPTYQCHIELAAKSKITIDGCTAAGNTVFVNGSASASALLIRATNFTQTGTFAWTELQGGGRFISPFMENNVDGDFKLLNGKFYSKDGATVAPNATFVDLTALPDVPFGTFIVTISIIAGDASSWQTVGLVNTQSASSVVTILRQSTQVLNLTMNGLTVRAYENSGAPATVYWNITRIA